MDLNRRTHSRQVVEEMAARFRTWAEWGAEDERGAINRISDSHRVAAAGLVRRGRAFALSIPLDRDGPMSGRSPRINPQLVMLRTPNDPFRDDGGLQRVADDAMYLPLQAATQWDAFSHFFYDGVTYNNRGLNSVNTFGGATANSITAVADGVIGRGVLLDIARFRKMDTLPPGYAIQADDLEACADFQGVQVRDGDIVLVRTGHLAASRSAGWAGFAGGDSPGLGLSAADFLCRREVAAVAADTWGVEVIPYETSEIIAPLHVVLLVNAGVLIGEMWDLEALSADCASDGTYEFLLDATPLPISGAVGSPLNPIALK